VIVRTGQKALDADAKAYVTLIGEKGQSPEFQLSQPGKSVFESGRFACV
jgi:hypothetical protein